MSVTFSGGGVTISGGGWTLTPPPSTATAGWYGGGSIAGTSVSTIDRITFATDTATASVRGPLSATQYYQAAAGTLTYGWFGGGGFSPTSSTVTRITYAIDTSTSTNRGPLSLSIGQLGASSDGTTYGWFGGGYSSPGYRSIVQRITYATDTATATARGPLSAVKAALSALGTANDGWFGAWFSGSNIDRITYATDTATASIRGQLTTILMQYAAISDNTTYGWFGAGYNPAGAPLYNVSTVQRIQYSTDTATCSVRGPLLTSLHRLGASGNNQYGWFGGGFVRGTSSETSSVNRIEYANDTVTASNRGPLSAARAYLSASSGIQ